MVQYLGFHKVVGKVSSFMNVTLVIAGLLVGSKLFSLCLDDPWILQIAFVIACLSNLMLAWAPSTAIFIVGKFKIKLKYRVEVEGCNEKEQFVVVVAPRLYKTIRITRK